MLEQRTTLNSHSERPARELPAMIRSLRHRNFRLFWSGQLISLVGTWMQSLALQWLVYKITGSAFAMGTVAALTSLPVLLLSPFAGVLVDRYPKRGVIFGAQTVAMLSAFALAFLTFSDVVQYWHILTLAVINGLVNAVDMPARQAFTSEIVSDRADLMNAIALNSSMFNAARVMGPALAGLLVSVVGLGWAFTLNGVSFIAVLGGLMMMQALPAPKPINKNVSPLREFIDGSRYAITTPLIRTILLLVLIPSVLGFGYVTLLPIFADQILTSSSVTNGATRLGLIMMANGIGALAGALRIAHAGPQANRRTFLLRGAFGFGAGICLLAINSSFWLALPIMMITGFSMITFLATANTVLQTTAPDHLRGRVMGFYVMTLVGLGLVGSLQAGFVAEHWGAPVATGIGGAACIVSALLAIRSSALKELATASLQ